MLEHEQKFVSPKGIAVYPYLVTPDEYEGSLDFKVSLKVDPSTEGVQDLLDSITEAADAELERAVAEMKAKGGKTKAAAKDMAVSYPFEPDYDDDGNETGLVLLKAKSKAAGVSKKGPWERKIPLFDSGSTGKVKPIKHGTIDIWSGSELKVEMKTNVYTAPGLKLAGVSFYIESVQVLSLSSGNAGGMFGAEEDGYEADDSAPAPAADSTSDEGSDY
jgi:hypothetical protein